MELHHPHVAAVVEHGDDDGAYLVYDLSDGETATDTLARRRFPLPEVLALGDQVLWALEHIHAHGVVHGAITSDGIFLARPEHGATSAQLIDLGRSTRAGLGVDDDLHAVARVLYQVTAGIAPSAEPPPLMSLLVDEPHLARWDAFLHRALTTAPFRDATAMRAALAELARQMRRTRAGREGRAIVATAPSMKRAMHEVADFQTTEAAAIPADAGSPGGAPQSTEEPAIHAGGGAAQASPPPSPAAAPALDGPAPAPKALAPTTTGRRPTAPMGQRAGPSPAASAAVERPRRGFPWLVAGAFGVLAGLAVAVIIATIDHPREGRPGGGAPMSPAGEPARAEVSPGGEPAATVPAGRGPSEGPTAAAAAGVGATRVVVESEPSGAFVGSNGGILGKTPLPLEVPAGTHRFDVSLPGYQPQSLVVDVRGAPELRHRIHLERLGVTRPR